MCRWLAYLGEPLRPSRLVLDPMHSIVAQSRDSRLGAETVNGDGFGLGWYPAERTGQRAPGIFRSIEPAWNDQNLRELTEAISTPLFFAHVRAATSPPIQQTNCHPFRFENWMFMHNGEIGGFRQLKRELTLAVDPSLYPEIEGTTDTEVLFHLALGAGLREDPVAGLSAAITRIEEVGKRAGVACPFQGTVAVSDGLTIWAFRYSSNGRSRSLFHTTDLRLLHEVYPDAAALAGLNDGACVVVSEPLSDLPGEFVEVPESTAVTIDRTGYHHQPFPVA